MTPKEKALEIFNKMCNSVDELLPLDVKQCALIAVDEIINSINPFGMFLGKDYWQEVKQEIQKL
jgi:hypothetical protein